jgi:hypothetical protein
MNTRTKIAMMTLATLCIATGGLTMMVAAEQGPQSLGRLPVTVHSATAHGMTVPGAAHIAIAQAVE